MFYAVFLVCCALMLIPGGSTFILDKQQCIAYPPCTCSGNNVNCYRKGLTTFPKFEVSNITGYYIYLDIYDNQFTYIPANAFQNLTVSNSTSVQLNVRNNHINSIATNAFTGISDRITYLYISNNNLTQIPQALKSLRVLKYLDIQDNPISTLSSSYGVLDSLKGNLETLYMDLTRFTSWPSELNILQFLDALYIRYLNFTYLDFDAFHGFENTLTKLSITLSKLKRIPISVCHLKKLKVLYFSNNKNLHTNASIIEPCKVDLTTVTYVDLSSNNMRYMPDILQTFPTLEYLYLNDNKLSYIHWNSVPDNSTLRYLYMNQNDFTRIPYVVNKLQNLSILEMRRNKITSIEDVDLSDLGRLQILKLDVNPIEYISPNAFNNSFSLHYISLEGTNILELPSSLSTMKRLHTLYLRDSPITCGCYLTFMRALNVSDIAMLGDCHSSSTSIKQYLVDFLPRCP